MYVKKSCEINDKIEIEKYYDGRYGAPGMPREKKHKKTPEEVARQNFWRKCRDLRRTLELNFKGGDMHVIVTCRRDERPTAEEAPKVIRQFRDKVARDYKKQGWECMYVITCEVGKRGAVHWHVIINNMSNEQDSTWEIISRNWNRGRPYVVPMDSDRNYKKLAEYIIKETYRRMQEGKTVEKLSYISSRNLIRPQEKKQKVRAKKWSNPPVPPKGYRLLEESLVNGINPFTGFPYQKYTIVKIIEKGGG